MTKAKIGASLALLTSAAFLYLVLVLPNHPGSLNVATFLRVPLELPVLLGLMLILAPHPRLSRAVRAGLTLALTLLLLLRAADYGVYSAMSRPFNLVVDSFMFSASLNLLMTTLGVALTIGLLVFAALLLLAVGVLTFRALGRWSRPVLPRPWRVAVLVPMLVFAAWTVADLGHNLRYWKLPQNPPGSALTTRMTVLHVARAGAAARELAAFRRATQIDPYADAGPVFDLLDGRDVLVIFVESYGRTSFDNSLYAPTHLPTLAAAQDALDDAGLGARSFWLTSPIAGGQSWLAHGTFASGLATGDEARYGAMLVSPRKSLYHLASEAGYRTGAVMPAITMAWPEGPLLGFETILPAAELGYAGERFNWVTMPDQYTLSAFPDLLPNDPRPDFLQIALISSHAPWTPIPPMIPWQEVGDGRIFTQWAKSGDSPRVVWRDRDRVRDQYRLSVDYALQAVFSFAARQGGDDAPLIIILGDHPPAPFVSQIEGRDVPIHMIGPPALLARLDGWGAPVGLAPDASAPVWAMEDFRNRFIAAFTSADGQS